MELGVVVSVSRVAVAHHRLLLASWAEWAGLGLLWADGCSSIRPMLLEASSCKYVISPLGSRRGLLKVDKPSIFNGPISC